MVDALTSIEAVAVIVGVTPMGLLAVIRFSHKTY